jgi:outer membrane protein
MKNIFKTVLPALLLMTFLGGSAMAQTKIATVDLKKLFDNYWKTKQAEALIQEDAAKFAKDDKSLKEELNKGGDDYKTLVEKSNDPAVSAEERDRRKQAVADKAKQLQSQKAAIDQFERTAQTNISDKQQRMRDSILAEIKSAVAEKAKEGAYSLVIDTAAETINKTMTIVYSNGDNDLTDALLAHLNAGAPVDTTKPATTTTAPPATTTPGSP